jgi:hypothetical protein
MPLFLKWQYDRTLGKDGGVKDAAGNEVQWVPHTVADKAAEKEPLEFLVATALIIFEMPLLVRPVHLNAIDLGKKKKKKYGFVRSCASART